MSHIFFDHPSKSPVGGPLQAPQRTQSQNTFLLAYSLGCCPTSGAARLFYCQSSKHSQWPHIYKEYPNISTPGKSLFSIFLVFLLYVIPSEDFPSQLAHLWARRCSGAHVYVCRHPRASGPTVNNYNKWFSSIPCALCSGQVLPKTAVCHDEHHLHFLLTCFSFTKLTEVIFSFGKTCGCVAAVNPLHLGRTGYLCLIDQIDRMTPLGLLRS